MKQHFTSPLAVHLLEEAMQDDRPLNTYPPMLGDPATVRDAIAWQSELALRMLDGLKLPRPEPRPKWDGTTSPVSPSASSWVLLLPS